MVGHGSDYTENSDYFAWSIFNGSTDDDIDDDTDTDFDDIDDYADYFDIDD